MSTWKIAILIAGSIASVSGRSGGNPDAGEVPADASTTRQVVITATVPEDAPTVYVTGNLPALGPWHPAALEMQGSGTERTVTLDVPLGHALQFKITGGSWEREALGPDGKHLPAFSVAVDGDKTVSAEIHAFPEDPDRFVADWQGAGVEGELLYWTDLESAFLDESRHVVIWLPPDYGAGDDRRFKVIYMPDGQNLFDPRLAYTGIDWGVDEAMMRGVRAGTYEPAVIVGVWNTADRLMEYSPWHDAPQYARFLLEELMPRVEAELNVLTGPDNTFVMGSSMGGLLSYYLVREHPDVFGACGCLSSHFSWSPQMVELFMGRDPSAASARTYIERDIADGATMPGGARLYFDYGTAGLDAAYEVPHAAIRQWLLDQDFVEGEDFLVRKFEGADHSEAAWRERVDQQLDWLLAE